MKVKYGRDNAELYTEVAATRLMAALGFPVDRMFVVAAVRCQVQAIAQRPPCPR